MTKKKSINLKKKTKKQLEEDKKKNLFDKIKKVYPKFYDSNITLTVKQLERLLRDYTILVDIVSQLKKKYPKIKMTHMTGSPIKELINKNQSSLGYFEPEGLYYAKKYKRFLEFINSHYFDRYIYGINPKNKKIYTTIDKPNQNLILQIKTQKDDDKYTKKYIIAKKITERNYPAYYDFNFKKLVKDFGGIEFSNFCGSHSDYCISNYGCIWNNDIIKNLQLIAKKQLGKNGKYYKFLFIYNLYMKIEFNKTYKLKLSWEKVLYKFSKGECPIKFPDIPFMWKCKPISNLDDKFMYQFHKAKFPQEQDLNSFSKYFKNYKNSKKIVSFPNLSKSTQLVVPYPNENKNYSHLQLFLQNASKQQQQNLWKKIAEVFIKEFNDNNKLYLSTHGLGINYLHIRIKGSPDYGYPIKF